MAQLIPTQRKVLAKESELFARKASGAVRKSLCNRAMNLRHSWNDHVGSPAFRTVRNFDAL
jgi:hypothetical protein